MNTRVNPPTIHEPLGLYSHTINVDAGSRWLAVAGQLGVDADGNVASGFTAQAEKVLQNVLCCLEANGLGKEDLVRMTIYSTIPGCMGDIRAARRKIMGDDVLPAVTLIIVAGLAEPEYLVEIDAWAARPVGK